MNVVLEVRWIVDTRFLDCMMMVVPLMLVIRPSREGVSPGRLPGFVSGELAFPSHPETFLPHPDCSALVECAAAPGEEPWFAAEAAGRTKLPPMSATRARAIRMASRINLL